MFDAIRERMARRALASVVASRSARPLPDRLEDRSVLIVLPASEDGLRAAWPLVADIDLPRPRMTLVVLSERVAYAPDRFAGSVKRLAPSDLDWRGLPRAEDIVKLAGSGADVAINLSEGSSPAAEFLVGTSGAAVRIGPHAPGADPLYDLMLAGADATPDLVAALRHALAQIDPPILPL